MAYKNNGERLPKYLEKEQIYEILEHAKAENTRDYVLLRVMWSTGVRVSEAISFTPDDVQFKRNAINILHAKGSKQRRVHTDPVTMKALRKYIEDEHLDCDKPIFNVTRTWAGAIVKKYGDKIDKDIYPHMLRHSFAVHCIREGMDIRTLQMLMGHSDINTTQVYLQFDDDAIDAVYRKVKIGRASCRERVYENV
jgi:integrase/recombinase XerD